MKLCLATANHNFMWVNMMPKEATLLLLLSEFDPHIKEVTSGSERDNHWRHHGVCAFQNGIFTAILRR